MALAIDYTKWKKTISGYMSIERHKEIAQQIANIIKDNHNIPGQWDSELKIWKLWKDPLAVILEKLHACNNAGKPIYTYQKYKYVCKRCGKKESEPHTDHKFYVMKESQYLVHRGLINDLEIFMCIDSIVWELGTFPYITKSHTQMRNCNIERKGDKLFIIPRTQKIASHIYMNVDITQADIEAYDPDRTDPYLYEIFGDNYSSFLRCLMICYYTPNSTQRCLILAKPHIRDIIIEIIKKIFGPFCFNNISECKEFLPLLRIRKVLPNREGKMMYPTQLSSLFYHNRHSTIFVGAKPEIFFPIETIETRDVEVDPIQRSSIVNLALDMTEYRHKEDVSYTVRRRLY
jgi:hypothetical protein